MIPCPDGRWALAVMALCLAPAYADEALRDDVEQWLRQEMQPAVSAAASQPAIAADSLAPYAPVSSPATPEAFRLHALYGVGARLTAEFSVQGRRMRVQPGLARARMQSGLLADAELYFVQEIQSPCLHLRTGSEGTSQEACVLGAIHD